MSCKYSDIRIGKLQRLSQYDFYYSRVQYGKYGLTGYCKVWDKPNKMWRVFPYTFKVQSAPPSDYYIYHDAIWLGTGYEIDSVPENVIKPLPIR